MNDTSLQSASAFYQAHPATRWLRWGLRITSYNVCYTKLLRWCASITLASTRG